MKAIKTSIIVMAFLLLSSISAWAGSWAQADTGAYQYKNDDGTCLINTWLQDNGKWYFLGEGGWMAAKSATNQTQAAAEKTIAGKGYEACKRCKP